jgi:hypothetical protein
MTQQFSVGQCIRLRQDVPRFDSFLAKAGMTGIVTSIEENVIVAKMDQPLSDDPLKQADIEAEWENSIQWYPMDFPPNAEHQRWYTVTALDDFLDDCELIDCSSSKEPVSNS